MTKLCGRCHAQRPTEFVRLPGSAFFREICGLCGYAFGDTATPPPLARLTDLILQMAA